MSKRTYHINRSKLLVEALNTLGWVAAAPDADADLALWDPYKAAPRRARIKTLGRKDIPRLDDKRRLYRALRKAGTAHLMPETWLSHDTWTRDAPPGRLWFVKAAHLSGGRGIECVADEAGIVAALGDIGSPCVIQRGVTTPALVDGHKFTIRAYVLWLADACPMLYGESLLILQPRPWDAADLDPEVQFRHRTVSYLSSDEWAPYASIHAAMGPATTATLAAVEADLVARGEAGRYQLYGFDFLPDTDGKPWLIEVNAWPNFGWRERETQRGLKARLMADFAAGMNARLEGRSPAWGRFSPLPDWPG